MSPLGSSLLKMSHLRLSSFYVKDCFLGYRSTCSTDDSTSHHTQQTRVRQRLVPVLGVCLPTYGATDLRGEAKRASSGLKSIQSTGEAGSGAHQQATRMKTPSYRMEIDPKETS